MSKRPALDPFMLAQFTGSQNFYRHGLVREVPRAIRSERIPFEQPAAGGGRIRLGVALRSQQTAPNGHERSFFTRKRPPSLEGVL
jgi:hypothetical protein